MEELVKPPKFSVEIKQTTKSFWYVSSFKINAESLGELDSLLAQGGAKIKQRILMMNTEEPKKQEPQKDTKEKKEQKEEIILTPEEEKIFKNFKELRLILAGQEGVPPYVIFHDSTLKRIVKERSLGRDALVKTIGEKRVSKYGELIFELLEKHKTT